MIVCLIILGIVLIATGVFLLLKLDFDKEWIGTVMIVVGIGLTILSLIFLPFMLNDVVQERTIDAQIELYETENKKIDDNIRATVAEYMDYEQGTVFIASGDSAISLVSLYPDLKADALISRQIDIYTANADKVIKLKEKKIKIRTTKWWLYFGGGEVAEENDG